MPISGVTYDASQAPATQDAFIYAYADRATYEALAALGCDGGLGFFISRPLPPVDLARWLRSSSFGAGR